MQRILPTITLALCMAACGPGPGPGSVHSPCDLSMPPVGPALDVAHPGELALCNGAPLSGPAQMPTISWDVSPEPGDPATILAIIDQVQSQLSGNDPSVLVMLANLKMQVAMIEHAERVGHYDSQVDAFSKGETATVPLSPVPELQGALDLYLDAAERFEGWQGEARALYRAAWCLDQMNLPDEAAGALLGLVCDNIFDAAGDARHGEGSSEDLIYAGCESVEPGSVYEQEAWIRIGTHDFEAGRISRAMRGFERAVAVDGGSHEQIAHLMYGWTLALSGEHEQVLEVVGEGQAGPLSDWFGAWSMVASPDGVELENLDLANEQAVILAASMYLHFCKLEDALVVLEAFVTHQDHAALESVEGHQMLEMLAQIARRDPCSSCGTRALAVLESFEYTDSSLFEATSDSCGAQ